MVTAKQLCVKYGAPGPAFERKYMTVWQVPDDIGKAIPALPRKIYCNKDTVVPLENALRCLIIRGKHTELKTWDGCFNNRPVRGYEKQYAAAVASGNVDLIVKYSSFHAWATAVDLNAAWNRLGTKPTLSAAFVKCWTDNGWDWGGTFKRLDGMHFQLTFI